MGEFEVSLDDVFAGGRISEVRTTCGGSYPSMGSHC